MTAPKAGPTPGPWFADENGAVWRRPPADLYQNGGGVAGDKPIAVAYRGWQGTDLVGFPAEANARLIAAAPDHALFGAAVCAGKARWEAWSGSDYSGEVCVGGMRYATRLDEFGMPVIHDVLRAALAKAVQP